MKKCDNCKRETEELYFHKARLPNFIIKENRLPETPDEINEAISKNRISTFDMWICAKCQRKFQEHRTNLNKKIHDHLS